MPSGPQPPGIPEDPSARVIPRRGVRALCARLRNEGKRIVFQRLLRSPARGARAISSARGGAGRRSPGGIEQRRFRPPAEGGGATGAEGRGPGVSPRLAFLRFLRDDIPGGHPGAPDRGGGPARPRKGGRLEGEGDRGIGRGPRARRRREDDPVPPRPFDDLDPLAGCGSQTERSRIFRRADRNVAIPARVVKGPGLTRTVPTGKVPIAR